MVISSDDPTNRSEPDYNGSQSVDPENVTKVGTEAKLSSDYVRELTAKISGLRAELASLSSSGLKAPVGLDAMEESTQRAAKGAGKVKASVSALGGGGFLSGLVNDFEKLGKAAADQMAKIFEHAKGGKPTGIAEALTEVRDSLGVLIPTAGYENALKAVDSALSGTVSRIQKDNMAVERSALQMGLGMGLGFKDASSSVHDFKQKFAESILDTKTSMEDIMKVTDKFKGSFATHDIVKHQRDLSSAFSGVRAEANVLNVALLAGVATGMEASAIAGMMSTAYTEFGMEASESAKMLGDIAIAAKDSGLGFDKVSTSIMESSNSLKMWGGSVSSVTPIYKAFASSLEKGRQGLAPALVNDYVKGIASMGVEMKAFIGLSAGLGGGAGGGGALGAGLQMEELLSKKDGSGTKEISNMLSKMIQDKTGGNITTREEALAGGADGARKYEMQNRMIQQFLGTSREGANETMKMLRKVGDGGGFGAAGVGDAEDALGKLLTSGESTQSSTTDAIKSAELQTSAAVLTSGGKVVEAIHKLTEKILSGFPTTVRRAADLAVKKGKVSINDVTRAVGGKPDVNQEMKDRGLDPYDSSQREDVTIGLERAAAGSKAVMEKFASGVQAARSKMLEGKNLGAKQRRNLESGDISGGSKLVGKQIDSAKKNFETLQANILKKSGKLVAPEKLNNRDKSEYEHYKKEISRLEDLKKSRLDLGNVATPAVGKGAAGQAQAAAERAKRGRDAISRKQAIAGGTKGAEKYERQVRIELQKNGGNRTDAVDRVEAAAKAAAADKRLDALLDPRAATNKGTIDDLFSDRFPPEAVSDARGAGAQSGGLVRQGYIANVAKSTYADDVKKEAKINIVTDIKINGKNEAVITLKLDDAISAAAEKIVEKKLRAASDGTR